MNIEQIIANLPNYGHCENIMSIEDQVKWAKEHNIQHFMAFYFDTSDVARMFCIVCDKI